LTGGGGKPKENTQSNLFHCRFQYENRKLVDTNAIDALNLYFLLSLRVVPVASSAALSSIPEKP
jgi:hypothetical protein